VVARVLHRRRRRRGRRAKAANAVHKPPNVKTDLRNCQRNN
jgi:hypothetical protein